MSIKRYDASWYQEDMVLEPSGEFVRYEDHVAEVERLRAALAALKSRAAALPDKPGWVCIPTEDWDAINRATLEDATTES